MTKKQEILKKEYIKLIHSLKGNKFPDDDSRYMYMREKFGKISLKDMNIDELRIMLDYLGGTLWRRKEISKDKDKASAKQISMINGLWMEVADVKTSLALRSFISRITKRPIILYLEYLSKKEASNIIVALKRWKNGKQ